MAPYQGINIEEENEQLSGKDSTEVKTDTEENGNKYITKHALQRKRQEKLIGFEDPDKEKNKRSKPNRTVKKPSHLKEYELHMTYCSCA
ncbi:hypothetical protein PR048_001501 [Dryococelus australis]|uniref:Uncharacterized protein n=1 Tax=Dryococelus australis TaxID=614101 RepID=A0ABQ9IHI9_9NEOP|nr:hypothetical protein PR048_001501 [Dryococelus australis]